MCQQARTVSELLLIFTTYKKEYFSLQKSLESIVLERWDAQLSIRVDSIGKFEKGLSLSSKFLIPSW